MKHIFLALQASDFNLPDVAADETALKNALTLTFIVVGALTVLFIIIGAVKYVTSNGESSAIQKAKNTIMYAVIGLVMCLLSISIVQFTAGSIQ